MWKTMPMELFIGPNLGLCSHFGGAVLPQAGELLPFLFPVLFAVPQHVPVVLEGLRKVRPKQLAVAPQTLKRLRKIGYNVPLGLVLRVKIGFDLSTAIVSESEGFNVFMHRDWVLIKKHFRSPQLSFLRSAV